MHVLVSLYNYKEEKLKEWEGKKKNRKKAGKIQKWNYWRKKNQSNKFDLILPNHYLKNTFLYCIFKWIDSIS